MYNTKINLPKCEIKSKLTDMIEKETKKERKKITVEREKTSSEKKYNEYVKKLYKTKKLKDLK